MAAKLHLKLGLLVLLAANGVFTLPEQGTWETNITEGGPLPYTKSMYNSSEISLKITCSTDDAQWGDSYKKIVVKWLLRYTPCAEEYISLETIRGGAASFFMKPAIDLYSLGYKEVRFQMSEEQTLRCDGTEQILKDESTKPWQTTQTVDINHQSNLTASKTDKPTVVPIKPGPTGVLAVNPPGARRLRRAAANDSKNSANVAVNTPGKSKLDPDKQLDPDVVAKTGQDGVYLFLLWIEPEEPQFKFSANVRVWMKGPQGFLSAIEWPLLPFYGTMCFVYIIYGLVWLVLSACNWRDLLRIQFWIGGVIFLGMLEKAVFCGEYSSINITGKSVRGAVVFAELVSCLKRTLARMLVVIVSLGFGIVKPRLGPMLHRVLGMGALYFILGSVEGCLRVLKPKSDQSIQLLLAGVPLAVLDAAICWWVFTSLVQTTRTLRLRRNLVKLSLYRHFTNTLIFAVLASVAFMIWSIKQHKLTQCLTDWKEIWVDEAFWHLLFSVILLVIMILWRPTNNNQRYAFSPLLDAADDEAEEPMMNDAFEGMKMRGPSGQRSASPKPKDAKSKADIQTIDDKTLTDDDLKWIEENIPTSVTDTALPSLLDSDEEIMTTKFEMSKME